MAKISQSHTIHLDLLEGERFRYADPYDEKEVEFQVQSVRISGADSVLVRGLRYNKDGQLTMGGMTERYCSVDDLPMSLAMDILRTLVHDLTGR